MAGPKKPDYQLVLEDLRRQRGELDVMIAWTEKQLGVAVSESPQQLAGEASAEEGLPKEIQSDTFFGLSMTEAAKKYLQIVKRPSPMKAIHDALRAGGFLTNAQNFYSNLSTSIRRSSEFQQVKKNWGLSDWYQGRKIPGETESGGKKKPKRRKKARRKAAPAGSAAKAQATGGNQAEPLPKAASSAA